MRKLGAWFPIKFFNMRSAPQLSTDTENDENRRAKDFISNVDQESHESHFVVWTRNKHEHVYQMVSRRCERLLEQLEGIKEFGRASYERNDFALEDKPTADLMEIMNRYMEHEVVTKDIILRSFNRNPSVYIQQDF